MASFVATMNDTSGDFSATADGTIMTFKDYSNYDTSTESGHLQANFSDFRKIKVTLPDGTTYLFSTLGDGNQSTVTGSLVTPPIQDVWSSYTGGDGIYEVRLYTVPTYSALATYTSVLNHHVYSGGYIYKALKPVPIGTSVTDTTYWSVVSDLDLLPSKYRFYKKYGVICDSEICYAEKLYSALCSNENVGCNLEKIVLNREWLVANKLMLILEEVGNAIDDEDWVGAKNMINHAKSMCCCNS